MRVLVLILLSLSLTHFSSAQAADAAPAASTQQTIQNAIQSWLNSQLVQDQDAVNPQDLAGSIVLRKSGEKDQYLNIVPAEERSKFAPRDLNNKTFQSMVTNDNAVKLGILGFLGITIDIKSILEVVITDGWEIDGPNFVSDAAVRRNLFEIGRIYAAKGYDVLYNQNVKSSTLLATEYRQSSADAKGTFTYVDLDGTSYQEYSGANQKQLIAISPFPVTDLAMNYDENSDTWLKKATTATATTPTPSNSNTPTSLTAASLVKFQPADVALLKTNLDKISSSELKARIASLPAAASIGGGGGH